MIQEEKDVFCPAVAPLGLKEQIKTVEERRFENSLCKEKAAYATKRLQAAAYTQGISLKIKKNKELGLAKQSYIV